MHFTMPSPTRRFSPAPPAHRRSATHHPRRTFAPLHIVDQGDHKQTRAVAEWIGCPTCDKVFVGAAVVNDEPTTDHAAAYGSTYAVCRSLYCDHCNILYKWFQASNADGSILQPRTERDDPPAQIRDQRAIDKFLRAHPQAAGVLQS